MQNYTDRRTLLIKEMLRENLYFKQIKVLPAELGLRRSQLSKNDEEVITDMTYIMEEYFFPKGDVIYNKGDIMDGILFVIEGEVNITLESNAN